MKGNELAQTELINLNTKLNCDKQTSYPFGLWGHSATILDNKSFIVCGGYFGTPYSRNGTPFCRIFTKWNKWKGFHSMKTYRRYLSLEFLQNKIYAIGGLHGASSTMESIEKEGDDWTIHPLPKNLGLGHGHCVTKISDYEFILTGGKNKSGVVSI